MMIPCKISKLSILSSFLSYFGRGHVSDFPPFDESKGDRWDGGVGGGSAALIGAGISPLPQLQRVVRPSSPILSFSKFSHLDPMPQE